MEPVLPPLKPIPIKDRVSVLYVEKGNLDVLDGDEVVGANRAGQRQGFLHGLDGIREAAGFGVSRRQRAEVARVAASAQPASRFGQLHRLAAVAELRLLARGAQHGQVVQHRIEVRFEPERLAIIVRVASSPFPNSSSHEAHHKEP